MSNKITIDNLPPDAFRRWALEQETLAKEERPLTPPATQVDAIQPTYMSESDQLFHLEQTGKTWAIFFLPQGYVLRTYRVFPFRLLPELGSEEKLEILMTNIKNLPLPTPNAQKEALAWEEEQKIKEFEQSKKKILVLLGLLRSLDKVLIEINSKRRQYLRE